MLKIGVLVALAASAALSSCAYPTSTIEQGDLPSGVYFSHAPVEARAFIDGADVGLAASYDGKKIVLPVQAGRHQITVRVSGVIVVDKPVYVGPGSRVQVEVP